MNSEPLATPAILESITVNLKNFIPTLGKELLRRQQNDLDISIKPDGTKVTDSDLWAEEQVVSFLKSHYDYAIISEEHENPPLTNSLTWTIDPIDGTNSYIAGEESFAVMVGLMQNKAPIFGFLYLPANNCGYYAYDIPEKKGAFKFFTKSLARTKEALTNDERIKVATPTDSPILLRSRGNQPLRDWQKSVIEHFNIKEVTRMGSLGIKLAQIAEGTAHYYFNFTSQFGIWDLVPSIVILEQAGGLVWTAKGEKLEYHTTNGKYTAGLLASYRDQYDEFQNVMNDCK